MNAIQTVVTETSTFEPSATFKQQANISGIEAYRALCAEAEQDYSGFWGKLANKNLDWKKPFTQVLDESDAPFYRWFQDGELNASWNCLDRHLATQGDKTAIIFEADDGSSTHISYKQLHSRVCRFANALKAQGITCGDRVIIYLPMSVEAIVAMQACARIGASFCRLWRLLCQESARAHHRCRCQTGDYFRWSISWRESNTAQSRRR